MPQYECDAQLQALLAASSDGVVAYDRDLRYTRWNPVMERYTGLAAPDVIGKEAEVVLPFLRDIGEIANMRKALAGEAVESEARGVFGSPTGQQGYFESKHVPILDAAGDVIGGLGLIRRVSTAIATADTRAPSAVFSPETLHLLQLQDLVRALTVAVTPGEVGEVILTHAMRSFGSTRGVITRFPAAGSDVADVLISTGAGPGAPPQWCTLPLGRPLPTTVAMKTRQSVFHSTRESLLENYPESAAWVNGTGLFAFAAVPLIAENRVVGALGLGFNKPRTFSNEARDFLATLAAPCAQAFERSFAFERERLAREAAEAANQAKDRFIANLSHEIRTPLCALINFAEFLTDVELDRSKREKFIDGVRRNGKTLVRLIDDILDLSRIESGRVRLRPEPVVLASIVDEVEGLFQEQAREKGLMFETRLAPGLPDVVTTDVVRLRQILVNLVSNAVKFTLHGRITLEARMAADPCSNGRVRLEFEVRDTGIGLTLEDQERVFEPFFQVDNSLTREYSGTGLGLALSQRLARVLGGEVRIEGSRLGEGSRFLLSLEVPEMTRENHLPASGPFATGPGTRAPLQRQSTRVLVVEDQKDIQDILQLMLQTEGVTCRVVGNGRLAVDAVAVDAFDLVLMDLQMPVMDGFTALKAIRAGGGRMPIVAITAHALEDDRRRVHEAGFSAHLTKPIERQALARILNQLTSSDLPSTCPAK